MSHAPTLPIAEWKTMVSRIPVQSRGNMHIVKRVIPQGTILPLNDTGYEGIIFSRDTEVTLLREGNPEGIDQASVWMSDTPMEYYSMWELVARVNGPRVLVAGLGLGLLVHILALRRDITHITVVELNEDVIKMVKPYLPKYDGLKIDVFCRDFFQYAHEYSQGDFDYIEYDDVIVDIWKDASEDAVFKDARMACEDNFMDAQHLFWAFQYQHDADVAKYIYYGNRRDRADKDESACAESESEK